MCFSSPSIPEPKPLPPTPTVDDDAVRERQRKEALILSSSKGRSATVKSDLAPSDVMGERKVLLGQ